MQCAETGGMSQGAEILSCDLSSEDFGEINSVRCSRLGYIGWFN